MFHRLLPHRPPTRFHQVASFRPTDRLPCLRRLKSYLAPPFLLDHYTPRYLTLTPQEEARKRSEAYAHLRRCNLCPRRCDVDRFTRRGTCLVGADVVVSTIAPHFGEEPCIQGHRGSGSVFFCKTSSFLFITTAPIPYQQHTQPPLADSF